MPSVANAEPDDSDSPREFVLGWYGRPVARMRYDGADFGFDYETGWLLPLESYGRSPGQAPMFLRSFLPAWLGERNYDAKVGHEMARYFGTQQERFLANVCVVNDLARLNALGIERLQARLHDFVDEDAIFSGRHSRMAPLTREMLADMTALAQEHRLTQISGAQTKIAMHLGADGELSLAAQRPATHIVKFAGCGGDTQFVRGAAEWVGMTLARAGGVNCAQFALVELANGHGPTLNYLTERFDLPIGPADDRLIFCEELGAAMGLRPSASDMIDLNDVIGGVRRMSTNFRRDFKELFRQVAANCLLENADFHARNLSLLKVAEPTLDGFASVRLSPAYDVMRTREFAKTTANMPEREEMRLSFSTDDGEDIAFDDPTIEQFEVVGAAMGFEPPRSEQMLREVASGMAHKANALLHRLPDIFERHPQPARHVLETCEAVVRNAVDLFPSLEAELRPSRGARPGR